MLKEKVENQPETNQWFDEMVSNLRVDQLLLQADVLERQKKEVYEAMINGNQDFMHKYASVSAPFIKGHKLRKKIRNYEYENDRQRH